MKDLLPAPAEAVRQRRILPRAAIFEGLLLNTTPERAPCKAFLIERPGRERANACVREYEWFQRSNAMPPATPARPAAPTAPRPLAFFATAPRPLAFFATAPTRLAFLATARTRPFIDLLVTSPRYLATPGIRPADFGDLLALLLVERLAFEDFPPRLRAEFPRERAVVEPALRVLPPERLLPALLVPVWAISPPPVGIPPVGLRFSNVGSRWSHPHGDVSIT